MDAEEKCSTSFIEQLMSGCPDEDFIIANCVPENIDCRTLSNDGSTPLHLACRNTKILCNPNILLALISAYPEAVNSPNRFGFLPIHKAVTVAVEDHIPSLKLLIDANPGTLTIQTLDGQSVLHLAVTGPRRPSKMVIEYLCQRDSVIGYMTDSYGQLPLHKLAARPRVEADVVQAVIESNPHALSLKDSRGFHPLHWLLCRGNPNIDVLLILLEEYKEGLLEIDYEGRTPLMRYILNIDKDKDLEALLADMTEMAREDRLDKQKKQLENGGSRLSSRPKNSRQSSNRSMKKSPPQKPSMKQMI